MDLNPKRQGAIFWLWCIVFASALFVLHYAIVLPSSLQYIIKYRSAFGVFRPILGFVCNFEQLEKANNTLSHSRNSFTRDS